MQSSIHPYYYSLSHQGRAVGNIGEQSSLLNNAIYWVYGSGILLSYYLLARTFLYKSFQFPCLHSFKHPINFFSEGELTRRRAIHVNNNVLADVAVHLNIGPFLLLGRGEQKQEGEKNRTNLANALEALIGAIYLDSDLEKVRNFIFKRILRFEVFYPDFTEKAQAAIVKVGIMTSSPGLTRAITAMCNPACPPAVIRISSSQL
jgi:hypothetical protein